MEDKVSLSQEQVKAIMDDLVAQKFTYSETPFFSETTTWICVDENETVTACYYYIMDGIKTSAPTPDVLFKIEVAGLAFTCQSDYEELSEWKLESDEFRMPDDAEMRKVLTDELSKHLPEFEYGVRDYNMDKYWDFCVDFEDEWERDEIIEEIEDQLYSDTYVKFEDEIYPIEGTVEDFFEEREIDMDTADYQVLTPHEAAEELCDNIDMGDNSF